MRYAKRLGMMIVAMLALGAAMATAAPAAEGELLGAEGVYETKDSGTATFVSTGEGIVVKCTSSTGEVEPLSNVLGYFVEHFKGCTAGGIKCTGLLSGEATGEITFSGVVELLAFKNGASELKLAIIYYFRKASFVCLGVLTDVRGAVIGEITNASGAKTKEVNVSLVGSKGKEALTAVNGVNHHLESSTGGAAYVESSLLQTVTAAGAELEVMY